MAPPSYPIDEESDVTDDEMPDLVEFEAPRGTGAPRVLRTFATSPPDSDLDLEAPAIPPTIEGEACPPPEMSGKTIKIVSSAHDILDSDDDSDDDLPPLTGAGGEKLDSVAGRSTLAAATAALKAEAEAEPRGEATTATGAAATAAAAAGLPGERKEEEGSAAASAAASKPPTSWTDVDGLDDDSDEDDHHDDGSSNHNSQNPDPTHKGSTKAPAESRTNFAWKRQDGDKDIDELREEHDLLERSLEDPAMATPTPSTSSPSSPVTQRQQEQQRQQQQQQQQQQQPHSSTPAAGKVVGSIAPEGSTDGEETRLTRRLELVRERGDRGAEASTLMALSELWVRGHQLDRGLEAAEEARDAAAEAPEGKRVLLEAEAVRGIVKAFIAKDDLPSAEASLLEGETTLNVEELGGEKAPLLIARAELLLEQNRSRVARQLAESARDAASKLEDGRLWTAAAEETLATALLAGEKAELALMAAEKALAIYRDLGDVRKEAAVLRMLSRISASRGDFSMALERAQESKGLCQELCDKKGEAASLECSAEAFLVKKDGESDAAEAALKAAKVYKQIDDKPGQAGALQTAVSAFTAAREPEAAYQAARDALEVARSGKSPAILGTSLELLLSIHLQNEMPEKALHAAQSELSKAKEAKDAEREAMVLQKLASVLVSSSQPKEALKKAEEARQLLRGQSVRAEATAAKVVVDHLINQQRFDEAVKTAREAQALLENIGDTIGRVHALQLVTTAYCEANDYDNAIKVSWEQHKIYQQVGYKDLEASTLLGIADFLNAAKGPREALKVAQDSKDLFTELGDKEGEAGSLLTIANLQLATQLPSDALKSAKDSQNLCKALADITGQASALQTAANIFLTQQRHSEAVKAASEAKDLLQNLGDKKAEAAAWQVLGQVHLALCVRSEQAGKRADPRMGKEALKAAETAHRLFAQSDDLEGQSSALQMVANANLYSGDPDGAIRASREALGAGEAIGSAAAVSAALSIMAQAHLQMEQFSDAMTAAQEAQKISQEHGDEQGVAVAQELIALLEEAIREQEKAASRYGRGGFGRFSNGGSRGSQSGGGQQAPQRSPGQGEQAGGGRFGVQARHSPFSQRQDFGYPDNRSGGADEQPAGAGGKGGVRRSGFGAFAAQQQQQQGRAAQETDDTDGGAGPGRRRGPPGMQQQQPLFQRQSFGLAQIGESSDVFCVEAPPPPPPPPAPPPPPPPREVDDATSSSEAACTSHRDSGSSSPRSRSLDGESCLSCKTEGVLEAVAGAVSSSAAAIVSSFAFSFSFASNSCSRVSSSISWFKAGSVTERLRPERAFEAADEAACKHIEVREETPGPSLERPVRKEWIPSALAPCAVPTPASTAELTAS
eukprot:CAMPEP_0206552172 /NCGR_PEP_ID=MMETSP0325_2-20121206/15933_1 /ASSEMBLY_ACC=CAM_ASM_000347 /TAXON_ID=2866 /ORGANISM="Crypthecodinium cohnii, Strain Seligo" /LENGTH=1362 /DNA_ID=CAMNT_0054052017 /DNA_START=11 /DNA_END=4100 /DNA_ORIENTATION=+